MLSTVVFERKNEDIAAQAVKNLSRIKWRCPDGLIIAQHISKKHVPELVVVSRKTAAEPGLRRHAVCRNLLIPGNCNIPSIHAEKIYTYGMSSGDFITLSSVSAGGFVLSIQKELYSLSGEIIERQDIPIKRRMPMSADGILALSGMLLLLGVPPDML